MMDYIKLTKYVYDDYRKSCRQLSKKTIDLDDFCLLMSCVLCDGLQQEHDCEYTEHIEEFYRGYLDMMNDLIRQAEEIAIGE